jgi:hypothetical protein
MADSSDESAVDFTGVDLNFDFGDLEDLDSLNFEMEDLDAALEELQQYTPDFSDLENVDFSDLENLDFDLSDFDIDF